MKKDYMFPEPIERQGITERTIHPKSLPKKARSNKYSRTCWSFRLKEKNGYAYFGEFMEERIQYYHILTIDNEELLDMLDYWDRAEQKLIRQSWDNRSFSQQNYEKAFDEEGNSLDPMDLEVFKEWSNAEDCTGGKKLPVKAEHVIVHSIIERLSPIDQRVFQYMFDIHMTEAEIKQAFELSDSAWTEEKKRFLGKVRRVFIKQGYDVPSLDEVQRQNKRRSTIMKQIEEARIEEEKTSDLGKSISSELRRTESTSKPRSFAAEEQELQDRQADLVDLVEDKPGDNEYGEDK